MRIAVVGSGISGLVAANRLALANQKQANQLTVFEAEHRPGGHTATIDVELEGQRFAIDTGFIVYNEHTYPEFIALMNELKVPSQPTTMGFSVSCDRTGLEYSGGGLNALFAQRKNMLSGYFLRLVADILRFNSRSIADLQHGRLAADQSLADYLRENRFSDGFVNHYLAPMASAIWSSSLSTVMDFPIVFFVRFFHNHGLLQLRDRPQWRTLLGGSRSYIEPLTQPFAKQIRLSCPVTSVQRQEGKVVVSSKEFGVEEFDQIIIATHSDQALAMLSDPSAEERQVLSAIPYVSNSVVLHTDETMLPENRLTWSSWNYKIPRQEQALPVLTYSMNILQCLEAEQQFCVTLNNDSAINPDKVLGQFQYAHPEFSQQAIAAQQRWQEINGVRSTWFCGAYWGSGFHEDGVVSALRVVDGITDASQQGLER